MATGMILGLCTQPYWNRCELFQAIHLKQNSDNIHPQGGTTNTKTPTARTSRRRSSDSGWDRLVACWCQARSSVWPSRRIAVCTGSCRCSRRSRLAQAPTSSSRPPSRTSSSRTGRSHRSRSRATRRCARRSQRLSHCSRGRCTMCLERSARRCSSRGSRLRWRHSRMSYSLCLPPRLTKSELLSLLRFVLDYMGHRHRQVIVAQKA
jgi:hypothetical protein